MKQLSEALVDIAEQAQVYDVTENAVRGARRRRRVRRMATPVVAVLAMVGTVLALPAAISATLALLDDGGRRPGHDRGDAPMLVTPLLDSPTRGSLAGNPAYLRAVLDRAADAPGSVRLPDDPAKLRVLFAGDVPGGRRIALVASVTAKPQLVHFDGPKGASVRRLELNGWGDLEEPIVRDEWRADEKGTEGYTLLLGPAGYRVEVSDSPRYLADGTVRREWGVEPVDFVLRDVANVPPGLRARFSRDAAILYEGPVAGVGRRQTPHVDPAPAGGRGRPAPVAAQRAADALAYSAGLAGPDVRYVVLWSDDFQVDDPDGGGSGKGQIATVMALTRDGGGPYFTLATDTNKPPNSRNHPTGSGVLGDPERALIVMRLPSWTAQTPDTLQIVAPVTAVRAEVVRDGAVVASTGLDRGVGRVNLAAPVEVTVRAIDPAGAVVAEQRFTDDIATRRMSGYEPEIRGW